MTSHYNADSFRARVLWAVITPFLLAAAAFTVIGLIFIPALCLLLDQRSRTFTGAAFLVICMAAASAMLGLPALAVSAFFLCATAAVYVLTNVKVPFSTGLVGSAAGGVLGAAVLLGVLSAAVGKPLGDAAATALTAALANMANAGGQVMALPLNEFAALAKMLAQAQDQGSTSLNQVLTMLDSVASMTTASKVNLVQPFLQSLLTGVMPGWAMSLGMLTGGIGYYLPVLVRDRTAPKKEPVEGEEPAEAAVPPFYAFRVPRYVVISVLILEMVTQMLAARSDGMIPIYQLSAMVFSLLMTFQALALLSFFLTRKRVGAGFQVLILLVAEAVFFWLMPWVGLGDALFDIRTMTMRMDVIRSKGKQVFTQDGLDELRKMDQEKKKKNNGDDGEDKKQ